MNWSQIVTTSKHMSTDHEKTANPGIDEVRAARMEISARYGHNIDRMLADHMKQQAQYANRLVTPGQTLGRRKTFRRAAKPAALIR